MQVKFMKDEKSYETVGNIKIKEAKKRKKNRKSSDTPIGVKIFVWVMFFAMLASIVAPLFYYFITATSK